MKKFFKIIKREFNKYNKAPIFSMTFGFCLGVVTSLNLYLLISCLILFLIRKNLLVLIFIILGSLFYFQTNTLYIQQELGYFDNKTYFIVSYTKDVSNKYNLLLTDFKNGYVMANYVQTDIDINYLGNITLSGNYKIPKEIYKSKNISLEISKAKVIKYEDPVGIFKFLANFKKNFIRNINKNLTEPYSSLLIGIVIGSNGMDDNFKADLINSGIYHIVSVSGYNFTILITSLLIFTKFINRKYLMILSIPILIAYFIVVGIDNIPALRAVIMTTIFVIAKVFNKSESKIISIFISLAIIFLISPLYNQNLSLYLSYLAFGGIYFFSNKIKALLNILPDTISDSFSINLSVTALTWPFNLLVFKSYPIIGFIANLILLPLIPIFLFLSVTNFIFNSVFKNNFISKFLDVLLEFMAKGFKLIVSLFSRAELGTTTNPIIILSIGLFTSVLAILAINKFKWKKSSM